MRGISLKHIDILLTRPPFRCDDLVSKHPFALEDGLLQAPRKQPLAQGDLHTGSSEVVRRNERYHHRIPRSPPPPLPSLTSLFDSGHLHASTARTNLSSATKTASAMTNWPAPVVRQHNPSFSSRRWRGVACKVGILHYLVKHLLLGVEAFVFRCICALLPDRWFFGLGSNAEPLLSFIATSKRFSAQQNAASGPRSGAVCLQFLRVNRQVAYIARRKKTIASIYSLFTILYA